MRTQPSRDDEDEIRGRLAALAEVVESGRALLGLQPRPRQVRRSAEANDFATSRPDQRSA